MPIRAREDAEEKNGNGDSYTPGKLLNPGEFSLYHVKVSMIVRSVLVLLLFLSLLSNASTGNAALQFDVFLGYDGVIPEASWFPVICEIKNDGPPFTGTIELTSQNQSQTRKMVVELPTGTLKRVDLPVFASSRSYSSWDVRLLDERGRVRGEQLGLRGRKQTAAETALIGSLARTVNGTPLMKAILPQQAELQPSVARMQPLIFPDNPLVLDGMQSVYLNSEKAAELKVNQVDALVAWLNAGGHLIVAVEQISDITGTTWLQRLFPCELKDIKTLKPHPELQDWLKTPAGRRANLLSQMRRQGSTRNRNATPGPADADNPFSQTIEDVAFENAELRVATAKLRDGMVAVGSQESPLMVTANRGRGRITVLLFSPELEPMRSWKNLSIFWSKLAEVPGELYVSSDINNQGWSPSTDGIFGAMIDSKQVHKLPVEWLLLLLIIYLAVIGPVDQFWLKKIGRPMLTWITFPCYVVLFSLLIYFIGYKLRAGESEWNELHLVDVLQRGDQAELRGQTYASVYSPVNQRYMLESQQKYATLRGEFIGGWGGGSQSSDKANVLQINDSFKAEIFVPVWTSQLFVSDWWQPAEVPLTATVTSEPGGWVVKVENHTDHKLSNAHVVMYDQVLTLGELNAKENKTFAVAKDQTMPLKDFVYKYGATFQTAVNSRQQAFGGNDSGRLDDLAHCSIAASFVSQLSREGTDNTGNRFVAPRGLDLSPVVEHGGAILLAWASDYAPIKAMYQFSPRRSHRDTLWRVAVPVK